MFLLLSQKYRTRDIRISISGSCVDYQLHLALSCPIHVTKNSSYLVYDFLKLLMKLGSGVLKCISLSKIRSDERYLESNMDNHMQTNISHIYCV